jgi:hypothetical protein
MLQLVAKTARVKITVPEDVPAKIAATSGHPGHASALLFGSRSRLYRHKRRLF